MYEIVKYETKYKEGVSDLLIFLWKGNKKENRKRFELKYENNPFDENINAVVALYDKQVVGFRGFVPSKWRIGNNEKHFLLVSDACVHIDHRRKGLFEKMTQKSIELFENSNYDGYLNLSSNSFSTPGYLKLGWQKINLKTYHRFTNIFSLIKLLTNVSLKAQEIKNNNIKTDRYLTQNDYTDIKRFSEKSLNRLTLCKNQEYFKFKFLRINQYLFYKYYTSDNSLKAYVTIIDNGLHCTIVDFEYTEVILFKEIIKELKNHYHMVSVWDVSIINTPIKNTLLAKILRFIDSKKKQPLLYRPIKKNFHKKDFQVNNVDILKAKNWSIKNLYAE